MFKKWMTIALTLAICLLCAACGTSPSEDPGTKQETANTQRTYTFMKRCFDGGNYKMTFKAFSEGGTDTEEVTVAAKNDMYYMHSKTADANQTVLFKDGKQYVLFNDNKVYMVTDSEGSADEGRIDFKSEDFAQKEVKTGTEEIAGKNYTYEEFEDGGIISRYCYEENGDTPKYIINMKEDQKFYMEISDVTTDVPDSVFEIPEDFSPLEY